MASEIMSVSLPARFLSAGQGPFPGWRNMPGSVPDSLLLAVRETGSEPGACSCIPQRQIHLLPPGVSLPDVSRADRGSRWYWIRFRSAVSPDAVQARLGPLPALLSEPAFNRFSYGFHQLLRESEGLSPFSDLCDYMLSALLLSLQDDPHRAHPTAVVTSLLEYIHLHCCEPLTLPDVSRALGYSEDYLSRLLHHQVSCSFRQYIHRLRMQRAKKELLSGFRSIREIAEDCGYTNAKFFSTSFLKYEGLTPSAYRNLYASGSGRNETVN